MAGIVLQDLPDELIIKILQASDVSGVLHIPSTCHILHEIVQHSLILQYKIQLFAYGLEDTGSNSKLGLAAKFSEARTLTQNWAYLQFRETETIDFTWCTPTIGDVSSYGIRDDPQHIMITRIGFIRHRSLSNLVAVVYLPAQHPGSPSLEHEIRLLTMDTSVPHPRADHDTLRYAPHFNNTGYNICLIQINQDYLALFTRHNYTDVQEIFIWNWRTGKLVIDYRCSTMELDLQMMSFALISPRHFAVTKVSNSGMCPPTIEVYDFHLPPSDQSKSVIEAKIYIGTYSSGEYEALRPFRSDPLCRLLIVSIILYSEMGEGRMEYKLFMMQSTLLDMAFQFNALIPWNVWGPSRTRLLKVSGQRRFPGAAFAARYAVLEELNSNLYTSPQPRQLVVLDFHPVRCRKEANNDIFSSELPGLTESYPASSPTVISDRQFWQSDIVTTLPYREATRIMAYNYDSVCISDDCVIAMRVYSLIVGGTY
ncbi:hypothetical protein BU17DRAFT_86107 [Hysterangium stoloniferum]|nr:hypothetical protein BU17DRAFT_86107 [Hysterangium stoloniferum]